MSWRDPQVRRWHCTALAAALLAFVALPAPVPAADSNTALLAATRNDDSRFIVVAVANEPVTALVRSGGTPRAYGGSSGYAVSDAARRGLKSLAAQYRLQQVSAWPIALLRMHCAVFARLAGRAPEHL
jgi:hypothetical protein